MACPHCTQAGDFVPCAPDGRVHTQLLSGPVQSDSNAPQICVLALDFMWVVAVCPEGSPSPANVPPHSSLPGGQVAVCCPA